MAVVPVDPDPLGPGWQRRRAPADDRFDMVVAAALLAVALATAPLFAASVPDAPPWWLHGGWAVLITAPLALRRRRPSLVAVVVTSAFVLGQVAGVPDLVVSQIAPFLALYSVGAWESQRHRALVVRAVLVAGLLLWLGIGLVGPPQPSSRALEGFSRPALTAVTVLANVLYLGAAISFGQTARASARRLAAFQARTEELVAERELTAASAVARERLRIARELHDVVAHHVSVMGIQAGAARRMLTLDPQRASTSLEAVEEGARSAVDELRHTLVVLRSTDEIAGEVEEEPAPSRATSVVGLDQLPALVAEARRSGTEVAMSVDGAAVRVPAAAGLTLYRVAQEALTNVRKHAGTGAQVRLCLSYRPGSVELAVEDTGGARPATLGHGVRRAGAGGRAVVAGSGAGLGLVGMHERVTAVGGTVEVGETEDGYAVRARVPLTREAPR